MKKTLLLLGFFPIVAFSQVGRVGINTEEPTATLDVNVMKSYTNGMPAGIAPVNLTGEQIVAMDTSKLKQGTFVFATSTSGVIDATGYWYWSDNQWNKIGGGRW